jgi:hypothetical protein
MLNEYYNINMYRFDDPLYVEWQKAVRLKSKNKCSKCDKKGNHAHHIRFVSTNPELKYDIDNGEFLCKSCHYIIHNLHERNKKVEEVNEVVVIKERLNKKDVDVVKDIVEVKDLSMYYKETTGKDFFPILDVGYIILKFNYLYPRINPLSQ